MLKRRTYEKLLYLLEHYSAVALLGPRQVGKTTLALKISKQRSSIYLDLESDADRAKLENTELYLNEHSDKLVILDEVHRLPGLFQNLRGLIDKGRQKGIKSGQFLLLGSASIDLLKQSGESLAGRISYLELTPFDVLEVSKDSIDALWVKGGFPNSFLAEHTAISLKWRRDFLKTYFERDIAQFGPKIPSETLRRLWSMLAYSQGNLLNTATLARGLGMDNKTITRYLDLLVDLLLVRRLPPWYNNLKKRLVKSPKIYLRDSGILHAILNLENKESILGHPIVGFSWEGFVIENILTVLPEEAEAYFYRTSIGAEIDLLIRFPNNTLWAIEIKRSLTPKIEKGFMIACNDLNPDKCFLVYPGIEKFPINNQVNAISLLELAYMLQQ